MNGHHTRDAEASTPQLTIPAEVSVALAEIAESAKEGLVALAMGAGLQGLACSVNDAVNVLPCSTCAYVNGQLS